MDRARLITVLNEIETKGLRFSTASMVCGAQPTKENTDAMKIADADFSNAIFSLRKEILSEGVAE